MWGTLQFIFLYICLQCKNDLRGSNSSLFVSLISNSLHHHRFSVVFLSNFGLPMFTLFTTNATPRDVSRDRKITIAMSADRIAHVRKINIQKRRNLSACGNSLRSKIIASVNLHMREHTKQSDSLTHTRA